MSYTSGVSNHGDLLSAQKYPAQLLTHNAFWPLKPESKNTMLSSPTHQISQFRSNDERHIMEFSDEDSEICDPQIV